MKSFRIMGVKSELNSWAEKRQKPTSAQVKGQ